MIKVKLSALILMLLVNMVSAAPSNQQLDGKMQAVIEKMKLVKIEPRDPIEETVFIEKAIQYQVKHGTQEDQAYVLTNFAAQSLGSSLTGAEPLKKIHLMNKIVQQYSNRTPHVINQLLRLKAIPKEYQFLILINPLDWFNRSAQLNSVGENAVYALIDKKTNYVFTDEKLNKRISLAISNNKSFPKPETSTLTRIIGGICATSYKLYTGREVMSVNCCKFRLTF